MQSCWSCCAGVVLRWSMACSLSTCLYLPLPSPLHLASAALPSLPFPLLQVIQPTSPFFLVTLQPLKSDFGEFVYFFGWKLLMIFAFYYAWLQYRLCKLACGLLYGFVFFR